MTALPLPGAKYTFIFSASMTGLLRLGAGDYYLHLGDIIQECGSHSPRLYRTIDGEMPTKKISKQLYPHEIAPSDYLNERILVANIDWSTPVSTLHSGS